MSAQRTLWGLLAGLGTGLAAGILLAPRPGKETLTSLGEQAQRWQGQLSDQWARLTGKTGGSQGTQADVLEQKREQLVHADFNTPDDLPHRPRPEDQALSGKSEG